MTSAERKLRVLLVTDEHILPRREGLSTVMTKLAEHFPAGRLTCLTGLKTANLPPWPGRNICVTSLFDEGSKWLKVVELARVFGVLKFGLRPDVIIVDSCWSGNIALLLGKALRIPAIMLAHGNEILQLRGKAWPKQHLSLRNADAIVAISNFTKGLLLDRGLDERRIEVLHLGADPDVFYPLPGREVERIRERYGLQGKRVLLTVGNLFLRKGQDMVIRALVEVKKKFPNIFYLLVGEGRDEASLRDLATSLGVAEHVKFMGVIEDWNCLRELYNICDAYIMTSRLQIKEGSVENFGIAFLEANSCGKPVIGGRSGGVPEAVLEGQTGLLVDPESTEAITEAIIAILDDGDLARRLGEAGRRRVVEELNWRQVGIRMEKVCRRVVAERRAEGETGFRIQGSGGRTGKRGQK
jgi:phosphatidylinositol alpha-1,6-mannosyltransferase